MHLVARKEHVGVLAHSPKLGVLGVAPKRLPEVAALKGDTLDAVALLDDVVGKVIWQLPGSILSTRAKPLSSSVPSATVWPSGRVMRYHSPGTGLSASSTSSISIQLVLVGSGL